MTKQEVLEAIKELSIWEQFQVCLGSMWPFLLGFFGTCLLLAWWKYKRQPPKNYRSPYRDTEPDHHLRI